MAIANTGNKFLIALSVSVKQGGIEIDILGYDIGAAFGTFPQLTDAQVQRLSTAAYSSRYTAWKTYIENDVKAQYPELSTFSLPNSGVSNDVSFCPI